MQKILSKTILLHGESFTKARKLELGSTNLQFYKTKILTVVPI